MSDDDEFLGRFFEVQRESGYWRVRTPREAVEEWEGLLGQVREGYHMCVDEYRNDLFVRDLLEVVLHDERLAAKPQMAWVRAEVERIDAAFKQLLSPEPLPRRLPEDKWWVAYPPRYAGPELAEDLHAQYGVQIEVREI